MLLSASPRRSRTPGGDATRRRTSCAPTSRRGSPATPRRLEALVADDYAGHVKALTGTEDRDRRQLAEQLRAHAETFTESHFELEDLVRGGGTVAARVRLRAVHGDDGRDVEMEGLVLLRVAGGRITQEWSSWDYLDLARQLGVELELTPRA